MQLAPTNQNVCAVAKNAQGSGSHVAQLKNAVAGECQILQQLHVDGLEKADTAVLEVFLQLWQSPKSFPQTQNITHI